MQKVQVKLSFDPVADNIMRDGKVGIVYTATAEDQDGDVYRIYWPVTNEEAIEESDCCDWENYYAYNRYGHVAMVEII